jgi:curved DNA-binding protein CbpA
VEVFLLEPWARATILDVAFLVASPRVRCVDEEVSCWLPSASLEDLAGRRSDEMQALDTTIPLATQHCTTSYTQIGQPKTRRNMKTFNFRMTTLSRQLERMNHLKARKFTSTAFQTFKFVYGPSVNSEVLANHTRMRGHSYKLKGLRSYTSKATNAYQVLNINENATQDEIKKAFYRLAFDHHPDRVSDGTEEEKQQRTALFILITHSYEILSNPSKRTMYDIDRKHGMDPLFKSRSSPGKSTSSHMDPWYKPEYEMRWDEFDMFNQRGTSGKQPWRAGAGFARPDPGLSEEEVRQRDRPMYALIGMFVVAGVGMTIAQLTRMRKLMAESLDLRTREANLYLSESKLKSKQGGRGFKEKEIALARERKQIAQSEAAGSV